MIYFGGCSYVKGVELENEEQSRFSTLVGKKLNKEVVNTAWGGASNSRHTRKLVEAFNTRNDIESVFIMWSPIQRTEQFLTAEWIESQDGYFQVSPKKFLDKKDSNYKKLRRYNTYYDAMQVWANDIWSTSSQIADYFQNILTVQALCKSNNVPLMMTNSSRKFTIDVFIDHVFKDELEYQTLHNLRNQIDINNWMKKDINFGMTEYCTFCNLEIGPRFHPLEQGHERFAIEIAKDLKCL
jgi:hypothetical protein